ncbi:hypothetical protein IWZ00DRAFT_311088 [Phyllosticta capitalensis]|uniref:Uncharacterized protein n=1 Tax=Phyllosticta capitalensis TaxID=121624 RepID=A0ABR1YK54_9PEZI
MSKAYTSLTISFAFWRFSPLFSSHRFSFLLPLFMHHAHPHQRPLSSQPIPLFDVFLAPPFHDHSPSLLAPLPLLGTSAALKIPAVRAVPPPPTPLHLATLVTYPSQRHPEARLADGADARRRHRTALPHVVDGTPDTARTGVCSWSCRLIPAGTLAHTNKTLEAGLTDSACGTNAS